MSFKVGDKVFDQLCGEGEIEFIAEDLPYCIGVKFEHAFNLYTKDGKYWEEDAEPRLTKATIPNRIFEKIVCVIVLLLFAFAVKAETLEQRVKKLEAAQPRNYNYPEQIWKRNRESYNQSSQESRYKDRPIQIYSRPVPSVRHRSGN